MAAGSKERNLSDFVVEDDDDDDAEGGSVGDGGDGGLMFCPVPSDPRKVASLAYCACVHINSEHCLGFRV